jgi:imidazolonepropionase-like amidohydrolase
MKMKTKRTRLTRRTLLAAAGVWPAATLASAQVPAQSSRKRSDPARQLQIVGGTLLRAERPPLEHSVIRISGDRIVSVGTVVDPRVERQIDAKGQFVTAGFTDLLTQTGVVEVELESSSRDDAQGGERAIRAAFRTSDGYNPDSTIIPITRLEGVTSVGVIPTGGLIAGRSAWADLDGALPPDALANEALALHVYMDHRSSRGADLVELREVFDAARAFKASPGAYDRNQFRKVNASRADLVTLGWALDRQLPVVFHADRATDLLAALEFAQQYQLRPVLASAAEAWKVAPQIAAAKAPVIVNPLDSGPGSFSSIAAREDNAALLERAGVIVAFSTGETHNARKLRQLAGNAVRAGMSKRGALDAVTRAPAMAVGMSDDYGSVAKGKIANVVVWSGDPFETSTAVTALVIRGREIPLRSRQTELFERYR